MTEQTQQIGEFNRLLGQRIRELLPVQTVWATVKQVDWEAKMMTATGQLDDLDYYEVLLGTGSVYYKPKSGSQCLLGIINNNEASAFLIYAQDVEEIETTSGNSKMKIKENGFSITTGNESLKNVLNDMIDELNKIIVIQGTTINVPAMNLIKQRLNTILIE